MQVYLGFSFTGFFTVALFVLIGCKDSDKKNSFNYKEINKNLENSNRIAESYAALQLTTIKELLRDQAFAIKGKYWYDKADTIHLLSKKLINALDSLKIQSKVEPKLNNHLVMLFEKLKMFKSEILKLDTIYYKKLERDNIIVKKYLQKFKTSKEFTEQTIKELTNENMLTKFLEIENDIRFAENDLINFSRDQFGGCIMGYMKITAIVNQNKSHLVVGEELIIDAGVGAYSTACMPLYKFAETNVSMNEYGKGVYKIKVENKPGKYIIPVEIGYTDLNGQRQTIFDRIEYSVDK